VEDLEREAEIQIDPLTGLEIETDDDEDEDDDEEDEDSETEDDLEEDEEAAKFEPPPIDPKYQPLVDLLEEKDGARMMIRLGQSSDLLHLDNVLEAYDDIPYTLHLDERGRSTSFHHVIDKLGDRKSVV